MLVVVKRHIMFANPSEKYVTRDIGTQARDKDSNGSASMKRRYKKNTKSPKNQRKAKGNPTSYRYITQCRNQQRH